MKIILSVVGVLVVVIGGMFFANSQPVSKNEIEVKKEMQEVTHGENAMEDKTITEETAVEEVTGEKTIVAEKVMEAKSGQGTFENYSPDKLAMAKTGKVILFFSATWCGTCKSLGNDITANSTKIPNGVHILKVDYDSATGLRQKYGVTYQHTLVQVDSSGNMIAKWQGSPSLESLLSKVK